MKDMVFPHLLDIATSHEVGFIFERPENQDDGNCLVMCFRTVALIHTAAGQRTAAPGDCIVHDPGFRLWHASVPGTPAGFVNDWIYIASEAVAPLLEKLSIPCNVLLPAGNPDLLADALRRIRAELTANDDYSRQVIHDTIFHMLLDIHRNYGKYRAVRAAMTTSELNHYPAFVRLRNRLLDAPEHEYTIKELAAQTNLSPGRFAVLYRKFFHAAPHTEVLEQRLIKAKRLLKTTAYQVKEIAMLCGWRDEHYFSRIFHQKTGTTPGEFRSNG